MPKTSKYPEKLVTIMVTNEMKSVITYFKTNYNMNNSQAIRHILSKGIEYIAMYGDDIREETSQ